MKPGETLKTVLAWVGLLTVIPNTIILFTSAGILRSIAGIVLVILLVVLWRWRNFINYVRNTESDFCYNVINGEGDVIFEQSTSLLPLFWPIKKKEIFMSLSGRKARIADVESNCIVKWDKKEDKSWHGFAILPRHSSLVFAFGRNPGTRIELKSVWKYAVIDPPHDFVVTCGSRKSSRIIMKALWCPAMAPTEIYVQMAPFPVSLVLKKKMVDTTKIPWRDISSFETAVETDGSKSCTVRIDEPRRYYMYRIYWKPRSEYKLSYST